MRTFAASRQGFAIGGEELGLGEEAAEHGDDSLMKSKDCAEGLREILLGSKGTHGLFECFERHKHIGKALFEDRKKQFETVVEVDVERSFRAASLFGDGAGGDAGEAAGADQSLGGGNDFMPSAWSASGGPYFFLLLHRAISICRIDAIPIKSLTDLFVRSN